VTSLRNHVNDAIVARRLLRRGERIVLAVSGGVDSIVLLQVLHSLASEFGWKLSVAHFNHQLRGRASDADERLVRAAARKLKLPCDVGRAKVCEHAQREGVSVEMAARELRHAFLARCARKHRTRVVVLAQHANDQVELFVMRLFRGAGGQGLSGMKWTSVSPADKQVKLVRPLLDIWKDQLVAFAKSSKLAYREDASNASVEFERNWVRSELLPQIVRRHPAVLRTLRRSMILIQDEAEWVGGLAEDWLRGAGGREFVSLPVALQRRVIQLQLIKLGVDPDFAWIELLRGNPGRPISISPGNQIQCDSTGMVSWAPEAKARFSGTRECITLPGAGLAQGGVIFGGIEGRWKLRRPSKLASVKRRLGVEVFDADQIGQVIEFCHWQPGDRFQPIGMATAVKLQDWFTNRKIPMGQRHRLVLAKTERGELFWVEGERIGEVAKVTPTTRRVLEWRWKRA